VRLYENQCLDWQELKRNLELLVTARTLMHRMHQRGCYRCVGCQKPYVTQRQVHDRFFGASKIYLLAFEWFKSFGLPFLIGAKERVTRKRGERFHETSRL
jgi:hypothetical protein